MTSKQEIARIRKEDRARVAESAFLRKTASIYNGQVKRAKGLNLSVSYTLKDLRDIVSLRIRDNFCPYTGAKLTLKIVVVDHDIPVSRGGTFSLENLVLASRAGNERKGTMTSDEFQRFREVVESLPANVASHIWKKMGRAVSWS